jgi:hypothetical protein
MAITAGELIKRLQTYPEDQLVRVASTDYGDDGVLETQPNPWYLDGAVILQESKEDTWERGPNGDEVGRRSEEVRDESER